MSNAKRKNSRPLSESEGNGHKKSTTPFVCFIASRNTWNIRCRYRSSIKKKYSEYQTGGYPTEKLAQSEVSVLRDCLEFKSIGFWIPYLKRQPPEFTLSHEFKKIYDS